MILDQDFVQGRFAALTQAAQPTISAFSRPIVFVHGYLDNANSFLPILPFFKQFDCVAIDLAGHGKSSHRSDDAHYHLTDYVHDLYSLVKHNDWQTITLVGHSLGGIVSSMFSACFPELVNRLVLIESLGPLTENEDTTVSQLRNSILSRASADKAIKPPGSLERLVKARMQISDMTEQNARLIMQRNTHIHEGSLQWRTDKRLRTKSPMRLTEKQAHNVLNNILCPVQLILGSKGFAKIKNMLDDRASLITDFRHATAQGGHHVHMDSPEEVASMIHRFFSVR